MVTATGCVALLMKAVKEDALAPVSCSVRSVAFTSTLPVLPRAELVASSVRKPLSTEAQSAVMPRKPTSTV